MLSRSFAIPALSRTDNKTKTIDNIISRHFHFSKCCPRPQFGFPKIRWAPLNFAKSPPPPPPSHPELLLLNKTPPGCQRSWCSVELTPLVTLWPDWARPPSLPPPLKHWLWHQKDRGTSVLGKAGNEKSWWGKDEGKGLMSVSWWSASSSFSSTSTSTWFNVIIFSGHSHSQHRRLSVLSFRVHFMCCSWWLNLDSFGFLTCQWFLENPLHRNVEVFNISLLLWMIKCKAFGVMTN